MSIRKMYGYEKLPVAVKSAVGIAACADCPAAYVNAERIGYVTKVFSSFVITFLRAVICFYNKSTQKNLGAF